MAVTLYIAPRIGPLNLQAENLFVKIILPELKFKNFVQLHM